MRSHSQNFSKIRKNNQQFLLENDLDNSTTFFERYTFIAKLYDASHDFSYLYVLFKIIQFYHFYHYIFDFFE